MKLTTKPCTMLIIDDILTSHRLDPVRVITENFEPGKGRIIIVCYDSAWVGYWGSMSGKTVEQFVMNCDAGYVAGNLTSASGLRKKPSDLVYLVRIITAVQEVLRSRQPKMTKARAAKIERLAHANALIKVISDHGRRFFWNEKDQRVASMELDERGKIWWIDDYRGSRVCTNTIGGYEHHWVGFSHGGTLKSLVQMMRDYVSRGVQIPSWHIAPGRIDDVSNIWGYEPKAAQKSREAALKLPIIKP